MTNSEREQILAGQAFSRDFYEISRKAEDPKTFNEAQAWVREFVRVDANNKLYIRYETEASKPAGIIIEIDTSVMKREHPMAMLLEATKLTWAQIIGRMRKPSLPSSDIAYWSDMLIIKETQSYPHRVWEHKPDNLPI